MRIAMLGHKRIPSREGGVEIVVEKLAAGMTELEHDVTCYNRKGHHVSGSDYDEKALKEYKGVRLKSVWTVKKRGLSSSLFAILKEKGLERAAPVRTLVQQSVRWTLC